MKNLSTPLETEIAAAQSGWAELYDIYLPDAGVGLTAPASHWKCEEADGAARVDTIGGRNLTGTSILRAGGKVGTYGALTTAAASLYSSSSFFNGSASSFAFTGWFKAGAAEMGDGKPILSKWDSADNKAYLLMFGSGRLRWICYAAALAEVEAASLHDVTADEWTFYAVWHDAANARIGISVNGEEPVYTALVGGLNPGTGVDLWFGYEIDTGGRAAIVFDSLSYFDTVPSALLLAALWNNGAGQDYPFPISANVLRLCTVPGGFSFFTPLISPEPAGTRGDAQDYVFWPLKRDTVRNVGADVDAAFSFAASNVSTEFATLLVNVDWHRAHVIVRKAPLNIAVPTDEDCAVLFSGLIDSARITNETVQFTCSSDLVLLAAIAPAENLHQNCRFNWGDDMCTALRYREENQKAKTCGASSTTTQVNSAGLTEDAGSSGSYGTDIVDALADGSITASSEKPAYTAVACTSNASLNTITLAAHGLSTGDQVEFSGTIPGGLSAAVTYYVINKNANNLYVASSLSNAQRFNALDLTTSVTTALTTVGGTFAASQVKASNGPNYWKINTLADLGNLSNAFLLIPSAQAGLANAALKPYVQFDFGSAKTPRLWRISTTPGTEDLSELARTLVFFSSADASSWTHEQYAELPPRAGVVTELLMPKASTKRYWRICVRNRWGQNRVYSMLNKVTAYENGRHWWAGGQIKFDSDTATAALRNVTRRVQESYSGQVIVAALPVAPASGDTFVISRGCGKSFNACNERRNWENFGGMLDLPFQQVVRA